MLSCCYVGGARNSLKSSSVMTDTTKCNAAFYELKRVSKKPPASLERIPVERRDFC